MSAFTRGVGPLASCPSSSRIIHAPILKLRPLGVGMALLASSTMLQTPHMHQQGFSHRAGSGLRSLLQNRESSSSSSAISKPLDDVGTRSFLEWATQAGILSSSVAPAVFQGGLRGLQASTAVQEGDLLVSVPRGTAITFAPRQRCPFPDFVDKEYWEKAPWFVKVALMLLHQQRLQGASSLAGYVTQLPPRIDLPVLWDDKTLQMIQYPHLIHQVKEQRDEWSRLYDGLLQRGLKPGQPPVSREELYWAMSCVRSRTFSGPYVGSTLKDRVNLALFVAALVLTNATLGLADVQQTLSAAIAAFLFNIMYELILARSAKQYAMCPLIDLINHSSSVESEVSYDYISDSFTVTASRAYQPGEQIFVTYGQTNDGLMQYYGFTEVDNVSDVYVMTNLLKWLEEVEHAEQSKLDKLNAEGLLASLQTVTVARTGFPGETLQALRYLLATSSSAAAGSSTASSSTSSSSSDAGPSSFAAAGSPELEARLAAVLVHACQQELRCLGTLPAGNSSSGVKGGGSSATASALTPAERTAVAFSLEKKKVLASCLKSLGVEYSLGSSCGSQAAKKGPGFA